MDGKGAMPSYLDEPGGEIALPMAWISPQRAMWLLCFIFVTSAALCINAVNMASVTHNYSLPPFSAEYW
jgi:hypothetical protein